MLCDDRNEILAAVKSLRLDHLEELLAVSPSVGDDELGDVNDLLTRLQTMEAAVRAAREIIQCHETGYVTQEDIPCEIAAEIHSTRLDRFNAAVRLLEGGESDG